MFSFTSIVENDSAVREERRRKTSERVHAAIAIAVMGALLAAAVGIKLWAYVPGLFR